MKKYYTLLFCVFLTLVSCTNNEELDIEIDGDLDEIIVKEGLPIQVLTRSECSSNDLIEREDVKVTFYTTSDLFDFSDKTFLISIDGENKYVDLPNGNYYFEVEDRSSNMVVEGIFRMPLDLYEGEKIVLSKGRKTGFVGETTPNNIRIGNAMIKHTNEITNEVFTVESDNSGLVCIELNPGRYNIQVEHPDYSTYNSYPGFNVFWTNYDGTNNFFLDKGED